MSVLEAAQTAVGALAMSQPSIGAKPRPAPGNPGGGGLDGPSLITLVNRATFGFTQTEFALATQLGATAYIDYHLDHLHIPDPFVDYMLGSPQGDIQGQEVFETLWMTPYFLGQQASTVTVQNALIRAAIIRAVYSQRQLFERMVEFWTDHFNIYIQQDETLQRIKTADDRDVIRANALTTFGNLLRASATSPAMMDYLNNNLNTRFGGNENYAREIMELHTLGVNGGYTQTDVQNVAKCLTGWSFLGANGSGAGAPYNGYTFVFNATNHDPSQQILFAGTPQQITIPAGVNNSPSNITRGQMVLTALINHPSCAQFISKKMLSRFWGENPPQGLIDQVAQTYTLTGGDIKSMLRVIFGLITASAPPLKYKRPFHVLASALRVSLAKPTSLVNFPGSTQSALVSAGHQPFFWQAPDGYPDTLEYWVGLLLPRWNFGASLMNGNYSGLSVDTTTSGPLLAGATTAQQVADRIDLLLFNSTMAVADKAAVLGYLQPVPPATVPSQTQIKEAFGLAMGSPSFQWI
jgi:hypothetical protein